MIAVAIATTPTRKKFTVEEYYKLGELGMLGDGKTELIDGDIIYMAAMGNRHANCMGRLYELFYDALGKSISILSQTPVRLNGGLEPQPDLSIVKRRLSYLDPHPQPQDIYLLIEGAYCNTPVHTTIDNDRNVKSVRYSQAGIIELWIVDVNAELVEVYRNPGLNGYESIQQFRRGESISPLSFPDIAISVDEILWINI